MSRGHVVVVGSAYVDLSVAVGRLPQPGETVLGEHLVRGMGGKGVNQATAIRRSGAQVYFVGAIGQDDATLDAPAMAGMAGLLPGAAALLLQLEVPVATALAAAQAAREAGVPVVLNAAPLPAAADADLNDLLSLVDVLVVNETEAAGLTGLAGVDQSQVATSLRARVPGNVVITLGEHGAFVATPEMLGIVPPFPVDAVDAVGAGDAFCGELVSARYHRSLNFAVAVRRACAAGAITASRPGVGSALPTMTEIDTFLSLRLGEGA